VVRSRLCRILRGRGTLSRRLKLALFELTIVSLSQASLLGGLHRASRVPFRGSYFTSGLHPPDATPQRLIVYLYRQWRFPLIPSLCFVAHPPWCTNLRLLGGEAKAKGHGLQRPAQAASPASQTEFILRESRGPKRSIDFLNLANEFNSGDRAGHGTGAVCSGRGRIPDVYGSGQCR
jgi:hypothetical protein